MRPLAELRGVRFPDDMLLRMFFKEQLQRSPGQVLEFGCASGNNLQLFAAFGWQVTGVDKSSTAIADATYNLEGAATLIQCDLSEVLPALDAHAYDVVLMPSVNYYLPRAAFIRTLTECRRLIRPGGLFYIRSRLPEDWRWGRGQPQGAGAFRLECHETGEYGLLSVFYTADELWDLIVSNLGPLHPVQRLHATFDNPQGGVVVRNADVVFWGRMGA
ncbi:MAG: class I SAM-dependent methyltransferase [Steroidobacteraceae bacterium]